MNFLTILIGLIAIGYLLVIGKSLLVPLVIAIYILFIIKALSRSISKKLYIKHSGLAYLIAFLTLFAFILIPIELVLASINEIIRVIPVYEQNFFDLISKIFKLVPLDEKNLVRNFQESFPLAQILTTIASGLSSYTSNLFMVLLYILFLSSEQHIIFNKVGNIIKTAKTREWLFGVLDDANDRITKYLWYKTLSSLSTALLSYGVMFIVGLDFAGFWAMIIFLFNFIPSIGSIIATILPTVLAAIQFEVAGPILEVFIGIAIVQFTIGNIIEPKMMGRVLNLSPLTILITLIFWGSLWGITGMFVAVPITVSMLIIFSEFKSTQPVAIMLSSDGNLDKKR